MLQELQMAQPRPGLQAACQGLCGTPPSSSPSSSPQSGVLDMVRAGQWLTFTKCPRLPVLVLVKRHLYALPSQSVIGEHLKLFA